MKNVEALKDLYVALGGQAEDVADANTSVEVLNAIAALYGGEDDAILNPEAIHNIAAVAVKPSGTKTITENGTHDVAAFESAEVNVSGGSSYTEIEFINNTVDEVYESVLTVSEILTASASSTLGFMKTDTVLVGATELASDIPYVLGVIYENEDVPGTYDLWFYPTQFTGLNGKGSAWNNEKQPTDHITFTYQK